MEEQPLTYTKAEVHRDGGDCVLEIRTRNLESYSLNLVFLTEAEALKIARSLLACFKKKE